MSRRQPRRRRFSSRRRFVPGNNYCRRRRHRWGFGGGFLLRGGRCLRLGWALSCQRGRRRWGGLHLFYFRPSEALDAVHPGKLDLIPPLLLVYHRAWLVGVRGTREMPKFATGCQVCCAFGGGREASASSRYTYVDTMGVANSIA